MSAKSYRKSKEGFALLYYLIWERLLVLRTL
jgi:hypothetical protein